MYMMIRLAHTCSTAFMAHGYVTWCVDIGSVSCLTLMHNVWHQVVVKVMETTPYQRRLLLTYRSMLTQTFWFISVSAIAVVTRSLPQIHARKTKIVEPPAATRTREHVGVRKTFQAFAS